MLKDYAIFRQSLINLIRSSGELDIGMKYFILKDVLSEIEKDYCLQANKEFAAENSNSNNEKNKDTNENNVC